MQIKTILILCLIFVGIINSAENKGDGSTFVAPSYSDFIGKKYVKIKELYLLVNFLRYIRMRIMPLVFMEMISALTNGKMQDSIICFSPKK